MARCQRQQKITLSRHEKRLGWPQQELRRTGPKSEPPPPSEVELPKQSLLAGGSHGDGSRFFSGQDLLPDGAAVGDGGKNESGRNLGTD